jgi:DNA polymerase-4
MMQKVLGKNGIALWNKANGRDNTPVIQYSERKSISTERTFDRDTANMRYLEELIVHMVEKLAFDLRKQEKLTASITVKIKYSNFDTHTMQKRIPYTSFDHLLIEAGVYIN